MTKSGQKHFGQRRAKDKKKTYRIPGQYAQHHLCFDGRRAVTVVLHEVVLAFVDFVDFALVTIQVQDLGPNGFLRGLDILDADRTATEIALRLLHDGLPRCQFLLVRIIQLQLERTGIVRLQRTAVMVRNVPILLRPIMRIGGC